MAAHALTLDQLQQYLGRIGYTGDRVVRIETLRAIHRAHLLAIAYENLDIHFGRPISLDPVAMFDKLVTRRRGGWCYEMNGVLSAALAALGFEVRLVAGAVGRAGKGDAALDNHLVLIVTLDRPWIVDVGFGDGFLEPLPLEPGTYRQGFLDYGVSQHGPWWRVANHAFGGADGFDFTLVPRNLDTFATKCRELQTSPESSFVQTTVCERFDPDGVVMLRGAVLKRVRAAGVTEEVVADERAYVRTLADVFGLQLPDAAAIWPAVQSRHAAWLATRPPTP